MTVLVVGPSTRATYERVVPAPFFVQLRFQPGMARDVFKTPLHELANRVVPVEEIAGAAGMALLDTLRPSAGDSRRTVSALEAFLHHRLDRTKPSPSVVLLRQAVRVLEQRDALTTGIVDLAERLGASERTLRAAFRELVGISPKRYARIVRMRRLLESAGTNGWAHLAVDHGFYDQSHLNAEFRALLRVTPSELLARRFPIAADR